MATVLITGGHAGLGLAAAQKLATGRRVDLILAGRDLDKVETAARQIRERYGVKVTPLLLNLASLESVRAAASKVRSMLAAGSLEPLQALLCNAGASFRGAISYSADGYEERLPQITWGTFSLLNCCWIVSRMAAG